MILLSKDKIKKITSYISGGSNFLVFGTGEDSEYWRKNNSAGYTLFLEDDPVWIPQNASDVLKIVYKQNCNNYRKIFDTQNFDVLKNPIKSKIENINWDCILVDGPKGWINKTNHGRMESIYLAYELANENTTIFVDDIQRPIENLYANYFFDVIETVENLGVCRNKSNEHSR